MPTQAFVINSCIMDPTSHYSFFWTLGLLFALVLGLVWYKYKSQKKSALLCVPQTQFVNLTEGVLHYTVLGQGNPILLVHGIGASSYTWRFLAPQLARHFKVYTLDLPGFGDSFKNPKLEYGLDQQASRILEFMDLCQLQKVHIVGSSMGGALSLWLAKRHPQRFLSVATLAPATNPKLFPRSLQKTGFAAQWITGILNEKLIALFMRQVVVRANLVTPESIAAYYRPYQKNQNAVRVFLLASRLLTDKRLPAELADIQIPNLILYGRHDRLVPFKVMTELLATLKNNPIFIVHEEAGHHIMEDDPDWCYDKIYHFISQDSSW